MNEVDNVDRMNARYNVPFILLRLWIIQPTFFKQIH